MKRYLVDYGRINGSMLHPLEADNLEDAKKEAVKLTPSWRGVCVTIYELLEVAVIYLDEDRPHNSTEQATGVKKLTIIASNKGG